MSEDLDPTPRLPLSRGEKQASLAGFVLIFSLMAVEVFRELNSAKIGLLFFLLAWVPLLVVHELGHAMAARLMGWRVSEIVIGFGRELTCFYFGSTLVRLKTAPIEGYVLPSPVRIRSPRLESAFIYAGGPGIEILVLLGLYVLSGGRLFMRTDEVGLLALQGTAAAIGLGLFFTLVPRPVGAAMSDGLGIIVSLYRPEAHFREMLLSPCIREATRALILESPEIAREILQRGLARHEKAPRLLGLLAVTHAMSGELDEAHALLDGLEEAKDVEVYRAWVVLEGSESGRLPFARQAGERAVAASPYSVAPRIVLGRAYLGLGLNREAFAQFMAAYKMAETSEAEGWCLAYLALASHRAIESGQTDVEQPPRIETDYPTRFRDALDDLPIVSPDLRRRVDQELGVNREEQPRRG